MFHALRRFTSFIDGARAAFRIWRDWKRVPSDAFHPSLDSNYRGAYFIERRHRGFLRAYERNLIMRRRQAWEKAEKTRRVLKVA